MARGRLVIGNKRFSSWSMRGWLPVHLAGLEVEEVVIKLLGGITPEVRRVSPGGTVPLLEHDGNRIWESLAICEYCAELLPALWPADRAARAHARAVAAEMHAGFAPLRRAMAMDICRDDLAGQGRTPEALENISRIEALWRETRRGFAAGGPFLFGEHFGAADAMYAPVVTRFLSYRPDLAADSWAYCDAVRAHPLVRRWYDEAAAEPPEWAALHG
jgi:glutathione S-transferase